MTLIKQLSKYFAKYFSVFLISVNISTASANDRPLQQVNDLAYGVSLFDFYQENYFSSITDLLVAKQNKSIKNHGDDPELLLGSLYLLYGLYDEARSIFQSLINNASNAVTTDQAWFYLSKIAYKKGQFEEARIALENIKNSLPSHRYSESVNLLANIYLKQNQDDKAISLLKSSATNSTWDAYSRFNIGSSLIYKNRLGDAKPFLDQVSNLESHNQEQNALRDKANLALGYVSLKINNPGDAIQYFNKVRLNGALSSKALLGIGWAWSSQSMHDKSLIPWLELKNYSVPDPSVQESLIAIPYTLEQIGKSELALNHYHSAINNYTQQSATLDKIITSINNGDFINSLMPANLEHESYLGNLYSSNRQTLSSPYFYELFSSNEFQHQLRELQDLLYLQHITNRWNSNLPTLNLMLDERKKNYQAKLRELEKKKRSIIIQPLINKRNELARILKNVDALSLASDEGYKKLKALSLINEKLNKISKKHDISALKEKYDRLYGLLYWDINTDYKPRLWQTKKSLKQLDENIAANSHLQQSLATSISNAPKSFTGYSKRIVNQHNRIQNLNLKINNALSTKKSIINSLAIVSANNHKDRINSYQLRARYSLARLYDKQSKSSGIINE